MPLILLLFSLLSPTTCAQSLKNVQLGFPEAWDGDRYTQVPLPCPARGIPLWLDGYFLCQLSAAYGNARAPPGRRLTHMIDAIGAVGSFRVAHGQVHFSARYYPSRPFHIWEFYDRNMSKASVPWAGWSPYNVTAMAKWEQVPPNADSARFHPNLDFWRVGTRLIAGTEAPYWVGYEFDVRTLSQFRLVSFVEDNAIFGAPRPSLIPISMAIHERADLHDGSIWGTFSAMNFDEEHFYQGLFTIDANGVRRVVGMYDYGLWDARACTKNDEYIGDKSMLPGYIHSITSTEHFILVPVTSLIINPCKFKEPPRTGPKDLPDIQSGGLWGMDFYDMVPMRFLVFDKRTHSWLTQKPLEVFPSMFVTHQLNAYEDLEGNIVADMVVYDSHDPYVKYFYTDFLRTQLYPNTARVLRFTLDVRTFRVMYNYLIPQETIAADFPQVNHAFDSRPYQWAYLVEHPFAGGNQILKINVNDPAGARNTRFKPDDAQLVLHEPYFQPRPGASREDDGVLLVRALDLETDKALLLVVDATSMAETGRAVVPISVPFGFHNRFFTAAELGLSGGGEPPPPQKKRKGKKARKRGGGQTAMVDRDGGGVDNAEFWRRMLGKTAEMSPPSVFSWQHVLPARRPQMGGSSSSSGDEEEGEQEESGGNGAVPAELPLPLPPPVPLAPDQTPLPWWPSAATAPTSGRAVTTQQPPIEVPPPYSVRVPFVLPPLPTPPPHNRKAEGGTPLTVRQLYERTLHALCRWLPRVFNAISYDACVLGGKRAIRWMRPFAQRLAPPAPPEEEQDLQREGEETSASKKRRNWSSALRPALRETEPDKPWYNYRTGGRRSANRRR